ncbi:MAG: type transporter [Gemmatimonadetes bacterium]|nr:type transporter [Gemmatimonadota bacterium]
MSEVPDDTRQWRGDVTLIGGSAEGLLARVSEVWHSRGVLGFLVWRDLKVKYRQTLLGVLWAVLQPVLMMTLFGIFFGRLAKMPSDGVPYPLFAFAGLLPWTFVANAVTDSGNSLVTNPDLITKVYLPRICIPLAAVIAGLVDFAIGLGVLGVLMMWFGQGVSFRVFALLPLAVLMTMVAMGVGTWMSALNVKYRDVRYALPFLIQLWLFATPVIYPTTLVPARWRPVLLINPLAGIVDGFRSALLGTPFDGHAIIASIIGTVVLLAMALWYFVRVEQSFADVV